MSLKRKATDSLIAYLEDLKSFNVNFIALKNEKNSDKIQLSQKKDFKGLDMKTPRLPFDPNKKMELKELSNAIEGCMRCKLGKTRNNFVFGVGNPQADIVFVGEAPGEKEDQLGIPFVGRAGKLLDKILEAINLSRKEFC